MQYSIEDVAKELATRDGKIWDEMLVLMECRF